MEELRRRDAITIYASVLIPSCGFIGEEANREEVDLQTALFARLPYDYVALQARGGEVVGQERLRRVLAEQGLDADEIDALLEDFPA